MKIRKVYIFIAAQNLQVELGIFQKMLEYLWFWAFLGYFWVKDNPSVVVSLTSLEFKCLHAVEWNHFLPWWFQAVFG